ncbi:hypothetical protein BV22DRAFT_182921 [Leucogyrophana mollusca]|uniref:Uncharacterized protein n=1 Tax=Leucogyrophana mollusca TaxID=85980 RepID=A0ACB8BVB7_9AGAM|nr:hypothetical protein BV22DRAFT_182921 [Leucogyrophana mollusca]
MSAAERGSARERAASTLTLLKLSGDAKIRAYLLEVKAIVIFIKQLQDKKSALLAAYALTVFMQYDEMRQPITEDSRVPHHIVNMLRLDYFDEAIGQNEGFQIFSDLLKDDDLRLRIKEFNITEVFARKLEAGRSSEIRTSLICLDIFRSFEHDGPWARELVEKGLQHLKSRQWKTQKAGVTVLSSLAQTGTQDAHTRNC